MVPRSVFVFEIAFSEVCLLLLLHHDAALLSVLVISSWCFFHTKQTMDSDSLRVVDEKMTRDRENRRRDGRICVWQSGLRGCYFVLVFDKESR